MIALLAATWRLEATRLLATVGYQGNHPQRALGLAHAAAVAAVAALATAGRDLLATTSAADGAGTGLASGLAVLVAYVVAGALALFAETGHGTASRLILVLARLPLSRRQTDVVAWFPVLVSVTAVQLLVVILTAGAFAGLGLPAAVAVAAALACVGVATAHTGVVIGVVRWGMRVLRWHGAHLPVVFIAWMAVTATAVNRGGHALLGVPNGIDRALVVPWLVEGVSRAGGPSTTAMVVAAVGGMIVAAVVLPWSAGGPVARAESTVRWRWRSRHALAGLRLELTRLRRDRQFLATSVALALVSCALAVAAGRVPAALREELGAYLAMVVLVVNAAPFILVRGRTRVWWPVARVLGFPARWWTACQLGAAALAYAALSAPPLVILGVAHGVPAATLVLVGVSVGAFSWSLSTGLGWVAPVDGDARLGHLVHTWVSTIVTATLLAVVWTQLPTGAGLAHAALLAGAGAAVLTMWPIETARWQPPSPAPARTDHSTRRRPCG